MAFQLAKIDDIDAGTQFYNEHTVFSFTNNPDISSTLAFSAVMPETAGTFRLNSPGSYTFKDGDVHMDYRWEFDVSGLDLLPGCGPSGGVPKKCNPVLSAVPLPASLPLFGAALIGLAAFRKFKRKAS